MMIAQKGSHWLGQPADSVIEMAGFALFDPVIEMDGYDSQGSISTFAKLDRAPADCEI